MRIVLLGAPGSGKGTQATLLRDRLQLVHVSTGDLLRAEKAAGTPLGIEAQAVMARGELVSDSLVLNMLEVRLAKPDIQAGVIFDGYPRNVTQARSLDGLLAKLKMPVQHAILLDVPETALLARLAERARKEGRVDDTPATIGHRLEVYRDATEPVVDYYARAGLLTRVAGQGTVEDIYKQIAQAIADRKQ